MTDREIPLSIATTPDICAAPPRYRVTWLALNALPETERRSIHGSGVALWRVLWPWDREWWKPKDRRRNLVRAAALLIAEIERLDRAEDKEAAHG